ncbi:carbohydrate ABC transporter permease [Rhizobium binae]|uniref:carbohydrate ABC transporter permease n=1 Tax=Rhizobium binae TaxID=1138190 RepID=UPI003DA7E250
MYPLPIPVNAKSQRIAYMLGTALIVALWLAPLAAIVMTSVRPHEDISLGNLWGWPSKFVMAENYADVFARSKMLRYFLNSAMITAPSVLFVCMLSLCAGYVLSRFKFPGNTALFAIFVAGNFLPAQILMIPVRDLMIRLGVYDTYLALIIFHVAFQTGFATLFMRNFIAALPDELFDAARSEGASPQQILWHIVLPLVRPGLAALSILLFTFIWNDYFWALVLSVDDSVKPVTAGLASLKGEFAAEWNLISAGTIVVALPPVIMFLLMQRHFIVGLTQGAVKG